MLATKRQIAYLQSLTDRAEYIRQRHPSLIPQGLYHRTWDIGMTSEKASARIDYYNAIITRCNKIMMRK
jgi:hypothetical protein